MLHFQHIEFLLAFVFLFLIIGFFYSLLRWKKKSTKKIGDPQLVKELIKDYSPKKFRTKFILFCLAFALCIFAVAGLRSPDGSQMVKRKGVDIVIALDVSKSMLAQDIKPNRLERAKQLISRIIDNSADNRIGLVIFAGRAYLQMPLTLDHGAAKMYLSAAAPDNIPVQGTVISSALKMSAAAFNPKDKTFKSIILISDGEDHDEEALKVSKSLIEQGIVINTVGIGSPDGAPIMDEQTGQYKTDNQGQTVISKLNEEELKNIAKAGNGLYQLFTTADEVAGNLESKLSGIGKDTLVSDSSYASFKEYFQYFLGAAFIFLMLEFFISERRKTKKITAVATLLLLLCWSGPSFAQSSKKSIAAGNKAYAESNYELAEKEYKEALKKSDKNSTAGYNLGNTLYRKDNTEEAVEQYENVIKNTTDNNIKQLAFYNKGVAFQKAKKLPEAILAYKNALLLNPNDEDARQNLQRALKQQQEQEKDKKDNNKDKDKKENKDKKDQQNKDQQKDQQNKDEPKPQPSRLTKQDAEEKLKSLRENEKALQDKLNKSKVAPNLKPDKDW